MNSYPLYHTTDSLSLTLREFASRQYLEESVPPSHPFTNKTPSPYNFGAVKTTQVADLLQNSRSLPTPAAALVMGCLVRDMARLSYCNCGDSLVVVTSKRPDNYTEVWHGRWKHHCTIYRRWKCSGSLTEIRGIFWKYDTIQDILHEKRIQLPTYMQLNDTSKVILVTVRVERSHSTSCFISTCSLTLHKSSFSVALLTHLAFHEPFSVAFH